MFPDRTGATAAKDITDLQACKVKQLKASTQSLSAGVHLPGSSQGLLGVKGPTPLNQGSMFPAEVPQFEK